MLKFIIRVPLDHFSRPASPERTTTRDVLKAISLAQQKGQQAVYSLEEGTDPQKVKRVLILRMLQVLSFALDD